MANKNPRTTKKSPTYTRATTPTAMSIATTVIVITSIRLYGPVNCFRVGPLSSSHQGPRPSFGGAKVLLIGALQTPDRPKAAYPGGPSRPDQAEGGSDLADGRRPHGLARDSCHGLGFHLSLTAALAWGSPGPEARTPVAPGGSLAVDLHVASRGRPLIVPGGATLPDLQRSR